MKTAVFTKTAGAFHYTTNNLCNPFNAPVVRNLIKLGQQCMCCHCMYIYAVTNMRYKA